jgi:hypothetical protein
MRSAAGLSLKASRDTHSKEPLVSNLVVSTRKLFNAQIHSRRLVGLLAVLSILSLPGCASMINGSKQSLQINTVDAVTGAPKPASCNISRQGLNIHVKSNEVFQVDRDEHSLHITCEDNTSIGRLRQKSDFAQRYLFLDMATDLCIVSCFVDGYHNAWREYPTPMVVKMSPAI